MRCTLAWVFDEQVGFHQEVIDGEKCLEIAARLLTADAPVVWMTIYLDDGAHPSSRPVAHWRWRVFDT